jgi:hypothetical protein
LGPIFSKPLFLFPLRDPEKSVENAKKIKN